MTPTLTSSTVRIEADSAAPRTGFDRLVAAVVIAACVLLLVLNVFRREAYTGDEGFYGVTAQNMLRSPDYLLRPSYFPAGDFTADKDGFAHPPFNSYFYAAGLAIARGSLAGPEVVNALAFAALLLFAYRWLARIDRNAARFAVLLLAVSPAIVGSYSELEAEPLLTTFGIAALYCGSRGRFAPGRLGWLFLSGLCLGFSFALKLWLFGPLVLAVAAMLAVHAWEARSWGHIGVGVLLVALGGVLPAAAHLVAIAWFHPQDLTFWLHNIYFGVFTHAGISGEKMAGAGTPSDWIHPVWYYGAALYRDHFFLLPPILFGAASLGRWRKFSRRTLLAILAGIAGVAPLSLIKVKEPLYVLTCAVFLYLLAAACLAALMRRVRVEGRIDRGSFRIGMTVTSLLLVAVLAAYARHVQPDKLTGAFVVAHTLTFGAFLALMGWVNRRGSALALPWAVALGCVVVLVTSVGWKAETQRPRDPVIAAVLRPYLAPNPPGELSLIASNFKNYQYYTYHRGMYWHELPDGVTPEALLARPEFRGVRAFILSPEDQQKPAEGPWLAWLASHATELTGQIDRDLGATSGYRVFVRPAPASM